MPKGQTTAEYVGSIDQNATIVSGKKKNATKKLESVKELQPALSKRVLRKMAKIAREKDAKTHRLRSLEILQEHQFDGDKRVLFQQSGTIGTDRTKAEGLAYLYALQQSGAELNKDDRAMLQQAMVEFGDIESSIAYAEKEKKRMSAYAHKTATSNPFMPLSSAAQTISSTLQDRMLSKSNTQANHNKYSRRELADIASKMNVTEYDVKYQKTLKHRHRREQNQLTKEKLAILNSKKLHELNKDEIETLERLSKQQEMLIVLPKELRGLSETITNQSGGRVRAITSNVSGGQLSRNHKKAPLASVSQSQSSTITVSTTLPSNPTAIDETMKAAANLISRGLLTAKSSEKLDALFAMDDFSDDDSDDGDNDGESDRDEEKDIWGVTSKPKSQPKAPQPIKKSTTTKSKRQIEEDELASAASTTTSTIQQPKQGEIQSSLPVSLAMPTIIRTTKAARITRDIPIAVLAGDVSAQHQQQQQQQHVQIIKRSKNSQTSTSPAGDPLVQLPQESNEYKVGFQVLKSRDVRNFFQQKYDGVASSSDDEEMDEKQQLEYYMKLHGHNNADVLANKQEQQEQPKKRKLLFDFSAPVTVGPSVPLEEATPAPIVSATKGKKTLNKKTEKLKPETTKFQKQSAPAQEKSVKNAPKQSDKATKSVKSQVESKEVGKPIKNLTKKAQQ